MNYYEMGERRKIGVNMASFFPISTGPWGLEMSYWMARLTGFNGLLALPMRGVRPSQLVPESGILGIQEAWNTGAFNEAWRRFRGKGVDVTGRVGEGDPLLFPDYILFGGERGARERLIALRTAYPKAPFIGTRPDDEYLEIHPEAKLTTDQYYHRQGLVFDTHNLIREPFAGVGQSVTTDRIGFVDRLPSGRIFQIHVHPSPGSNELYELTTGTQTEFVDLLRLLAEKTSDLHRTVILETPPNPLIWRKLPELSMRLREIFV